LSRLLYDLNPNLYYLLKDNDVTPFYYAAPWFLTLFASQFPIAFCARVLGRDERMNRTYYRIFSSFQLSTMILSPFADLFFYEGPTAVFKVRRRD
jgi:hypothetical protein